MSQIEVALTNASGISAIVSFWVFVGSNAVSQKRELLVKAAQCLLLVGFIALSAAIVLRGFEAGPTQGLKFCLPLSNLYESLLWFAWAIMGGYLFISRAYKLGQLGWLASMAAAFFFLYGSYLPASQHEIRPLAPALVSYWMQIHVPPLIVSYAMFFIGGLSAFMQLFHSGRRRSVLFALLALVSGLSAIAFGTFTNTNTGILQAVFVGGSLLGLSLSWLSTDKLCEKQVNQERADLYDEVVYRSIMIGFPLLTIGIITGAMWANHAWGTYWSWDPKESMALATWLGYAIYIHLRMHHEWSADRRSLVAIAGMLLTILTYLGFSALGFGGLHSYGKFK